MNQDDMGQADWIYDEELGVHIPCCTYVTRLLENNWPIRCGNGPLEGPEITFGRCAQHMDWS